jgi:transaldolase
MASTGTKDPALPDTLYVTSLAAPDTVNTMPEKTLLAFANHGVLDGPMPLDGGDCEAVLAGITRAGVDLDALAERLQVEGRDSFDAAWHAMIADIAAKAEAVGKG